MKRLIKYRVKYVFSDRSGYLDKETNWHYRYIDEKELAEIADKWDNRYTTFESLKEDVDDLLYVDLRRSIFGKEYIYIHFPYDMEPIKIFNNNSKLLPLTTYLEVKDVKSSIKDVADELNIHEFFDLLRDQGFTGELIKDVNTL